MIDYKIILTSVLLLHTVYTKPNSDTSLVRICDDTQVTTMVCLGAYVHKHWVLASHICRPHSIKSVTLAMGGNTTLDCKTGETTDPEKIIVFEDEDKYDFTLIKLAKPFPTKDSISIATIAKKLDMTSDCTTFCGNAVILPLLPISTSCISGIKAYSRTLVYCSKTKEDEICLNDDGNNYMHALSVGGINGSPLICNNELVGFVKQKRRVFVIVIEELDSLVPLPEEIAAILK